LVAQGLAKIGAKRGVADIFDSLMRATTYLDHRRIPELYCGFRRRRGRGPTLYPAACSPQAWAAAAPFSLVQSLLGLELLPTEGEVRLNNPIVPPIAGQFSIRGLRMGNSAVDFAVRPSAGSVAVDVLRAEGDIRISIFTDGSGEGLASTPCS